MAKNFIVRLFTNDGKVQQDVMAEENDKRVSWYGSNYEKMPQCPEGTPDRIKFCYKHTPTAKEKAGGPR